MLLVPGCGTALVLAVLVNLQPALLNGASPPAPACGSAGLLCPDQGDPPPCPTCPCPPGSGGTADSSGCSTCAGGGGGRAFLEGIGMATYWVSEPYMSIRLEDEPLGYSASRGPRIAFHLSYRQRGPAPESLYTFGLGPNWSCSFRSYVIDTGGSPDLLWLNCAGASYVPYTNGVMQYRDGSIATSISGGYQIVYADGAKDTFTTSFLDLSLGTIYLLTSRADPTGNALTYTYATSSGVEQLSTVTDPDGRVTTLYYENSSFPNRITKVVDPYSRTNLLKYDSSGYLTNITDVAGLTSSFQYDAANPGWITNLATPYGSTAFSYGGTDVNSKDFNTTGNVVNRWVEAVLPTGGTDLYLFRQDCSGFMSSTYSSLPSTSPLANTLDNVDQENRNSFHWGPLQYQALSTGNPNSLTTTDYSLGRLRHWLIDSPSADASSTLSLSRAPSPDKVAAGQITWYDYGGKSAGDNYTGTNALPSFVALVLPDGTSRYTHYARNGQGKLTQTIDTYSKTDGSVGVRTNAFAVASNNIDLLQQIGPNGEQVVSNYFSSGNVYHQPDATYDALDQQTAYTYNANRQITKINWPSGLTTSYAVLLVRLISKLAQHRSGRRNLTDEFLQLRQRAGERAHRRARSLDHQLLRQPAAPDSGPLP